MDLFRPAVLNFRFVLTSTGRSSSGLLADAGSGWGDVGGSKYTVNTGLRSCLRREDWSDVPLAFPKNARIIGVVDMVRAIRSGRPHRASGALAYHVLEVMLAFDKSSESGQHVEIESTVERPAPLPLSCSCAPSDPKGFKGLSAR